MNITFFNIFGWFLFVFLIFGVIGVFVDKSMDINEATGKFILGILISFWVWIALH